MRALAAVLVVASGCSAIYDGHNLRGHRSDASYVCSVTPKHLVNFVRGGSTPLGKTGVLAAGYFDGDGFVDVALASDSSDELLVLIGNGDGTFRMLASLPTGQGPADLAAFDIDRDGHVDLAVANKMSSTITLWFGAGDGSFGDRRDVPLGVMADSLVTGDFDGNGWRDLALGNGDGSVEVALHSSHGRDAYAAGSSTVADVYGGSLAVGDVDGDGHPDLVASGGFQSSSVAIMLDRGGMFTAATSVALPMSGANFAIATPDLNGDGRADLVVPTRTNADELFTFLAGAGGQFGTPTTTTVRDASALVQAAVCDFDGDGHADVALRSQYHSSLDVLLGRGDGTFADPITSPGTDSDHTSNLAVADIDGDGIADVLLLGTDGLLIGWFNRAGN